MAAIDREPLKVASPNIVDNSIVSQSIGVRSRGGAEQASTQIRLVETTRMLYVHSATRCCSFSNTQACTYVDLHMFLLAAPTNLLTPGMNATGMLDMIEPVLNVLSKSDYGDVVSVVLDVRDSTVEAAAVKLRDAGARVRQYVLALPFCRRLRYCL